MIERLTGTVMERHPPFLVLDVNGVGYGVQMPMTSFSRLDKDGQVMILTHTVVREDAWQIFGFTAEADRALFRALIKINGVGPRIALAILSGMSSDAFAVCVADRDADRLALIPGIGKKTASRMILELAGKIEDIIPSNSGATAIESRDVYGEAIAALMALGYKMKDARRMVEKADVTADAEAEDIIRAALKAGIK